MSRCVGHLPNPLPTSAGIPLEFRQPRLVGGDPVRLMSLPALVFSLERDDWEVFEALGHEPLAIVGTDRSDGQGAAFRPNAAAVASQAAVYWSSQNV